MKKEIFINIALILFGTAISIFFAEFTLRAIGITGLPPVDNSVVTVSDPILRMRLLPNSDGIDANGFNNATVPEQIDIVALGDSHTYGGHTSLGRADISWPAQLASMSGLRVYNMGIWGYGTAQYRFLFEKALSMHPKYIVIGMYTANDLFDTYDIVYHQQEGWDRYRNQALVDTEPLTQSDTKQIKVPLRGLRDWLNGQSVVYQLLGNGSRVLREKIGISAPVVTGTTDWNVTDEDASLKYDDDNQGTLFATTHRLSGVDSTDYRIQEGWRLSKEMYREMSVLARENNVQLVVMLLPSKMTAYKELVDRRGLHNASFEKIVNDEKQIRQNMLEQCTALAILCIDAAPALSDALVAGEVLYPPERNEHPLARGYGVYAQTLLTALRTQF